MDKRDRIILMVVIGGALIIGIIGVSGYGIYRGVTAYDDTLSLTYELADLKAAEDKLASLQNGESHALLGASDVEALLKKRLDEDGIAETWGIEGLKTTITANDVQVRLNFGAEKARVYTGIVSPRSQGWFEGLTLNAHVKVTALENGILLSVYQTSVGTLSRYNIIRVLKDVLTELDTKATIDSGPNITWFFDYETLAQMGYENIRGIVLSENQVELQR